MNILVIHNNNLPLYLRIAEKFTLDDATIDAVYLNYTTSSTSKSFDTYVSEQLSFLKDKNYDIILLPFTLSEDNYLEYTGVRVAAHIRMTLSWKKLTTPILFVGPDSCDDVMKLSKIGNIINSYHVFITNTKEKEDLMYEIRKITEKYPGNDDDKYINSIQYHDLLTTLYISPPANYDTHHSIANEWAVVRWLDMFDWKEDPPEIINKHILDSLYFKCLNAKVANKEGLRQQYTKKWKKNNSISPVIKGIEGKRIVYIDDDGHKGWNDLLNKISDNSKAVLIIYPFQPGIKKCDLITDIKTFIDSNAADCFLIDLRLHDDDFKEDDYNQLTGFKIAEYIKKKNKGNQIVMFTASNKMWNYEAVMHKVGALGYALKESPEYNFNRYESYKNFVNFSKLIKKAVNKSYIAQYVSLLEKCKNMNPNHWNALNNYIDLSLLDETKTIKANVLNISVFLESYLDTNFRIESGKLQYKKQNHDIFETCAHYNSKTIHFGHNLSYVKFNQDCDLIKLKNNDEEYLDERKSGYLALILIALYYHYDINEFDCNLVLKLRNERNKTTAHHGEESSITIEELNKIFDNVICKIIEKDFVFSR